jgi:hypothetical protein
MSDIQIHKDVVHLRLKISKTDPFRKGILIKLFKNSSNTCPHKACSNYLKLRLQHNPAPHDPLFITKTGMPLSRNYFISLFRDTLMKIGIDPQAFSGHSFRIGAATSAAAAHIEDHLIKVLGRWSSDSYCRYIRTPSSAIRHAQQALTADFS